VSPSRSAAVTPPSFWARTALLVVARPTLWATAGRQVLRLARRDWWRRAPFLPLPDVEYLRFRFETQYGTGPGARPTPADVVAYLEWCHEMERVLNPRRAARHGR
jgi:hypothetical protein